MIGRIARVVVPALLASAVAVNAASGQTRVVVQGRVVERGDNTPVAGASVELDNHPATTTSASGEFRIEQVIPGGYSIRIEAIGYTPADLFVVIRQDTTLLVELAVAPVALDTLTVEARRFDLRGRVRERGADLDLARTQVVTNLDRETQSNIAGRFRLRGLPAGSPVAIQVRAFGYMPLDSTIVAEKDTSMVFELEIDPLAQRMIEVQVGRLEERSRPFRTAIMPVIDRQELLRFNGNVLDIVKSRYSVNLNRVRCILIDDQQRYNGLEELNVMLPEDLERIEVLERGAMLRIYTRNFIRKMLGGGVSLPKPVYVSVVNPPFCR